MSALHPTLWVKSTHIQRCRTEAQTRPWGTDPERATFASFRAMPIGRDRGRGRCGQTRRAPGESGRSVQSRGAGRPGGECPQPAPPLAPRLRLTSPWWSRETRRRYCAGPRAPRSLCRRTPRCRREDGLGAAVGAAERPRKRPEGGNPTSQHPPKCCCSPGVWSWATWRRTRWWLCSWSPSIPARVRDA